MNVPDIGPLRATLAEYGVMSAAALVAEQHNDEFTTWVRQAVGNGISLTITVTPEGTATVGFLAEGPNGELLPVEVYQGTQDECEAAIRYLSQDE